MMKKIRAIWSDKRFRFGLVAACYTLWVIWLGNYWWLFGLPVIFDLYITRKVKWAFWKKKLQTGRETQQMARLA